MSILSFFIGFSWFIYIRLFLFCTTITHLKQKLKKKNLDRTHGAILDNNWNLI